MVSNTANNSSCGPMVNSNTCDDSLVQLLVFGCTTIATNFSSPRTREPSFAQPSDAFSNQDLNSVLEEAIKMTEDDDLLFAATNDVDCLFAVHSRGAPAQ
ncbi:unnamed protein product [Cylindrotheca closterium]|uniref:Uncharacterized protein n=1 Tax=Cylindrotheca closterium TaxID=2856 RepID=A0AAD2JGA7_9STRA|nr:unnamed protein product [Cylindrotheca closterium]